MNNLLVINDVIFPDQVKDFSIDIADEIVEYKSESGYKTLDVIRTGIYTINVSYEGLIETKLNTLKTALSTQNTVAFYDSASSTTKTKTMKASGIKIDKKYYKNNLSVWSFAFTLTEL